MSTDEYNDQVDRRRFLRAVAATAVAATAAGGGAALLLDKARQGPVVISSAPTAPASLQNSTNTGQNVSDLLGRLAAAQADNVRLQAELDAAQRQLSAVQAGTSSDQNAIEALQAQLNEASSQTGVLAGLITLYEQLEAIDLGAIVENGLATVDDAMDELGESLPTLDEGLEAGRRALAEFEEQVPALENGRIWLEAQITTVRIYYQNIEGALQAAMETAGTFLQLLNDWFQEVLKWLPFGIGQKASQVMTSLSDLLSEIPYTLAGLQANIDQPLAQWLEREEGETRLQHRLFKPLRDETINQAANTAARATAVQSTYRDRLATPTRTAEEQRRTVRRLIDDYRQQHQV